jgi:hypothetical protein
MSWSISVEVKKGSGHECANSARLAPVLPTEEKPWP